MASSAARTIDLIDTAPSFTPADVARLDARYAGFTTAAMLADLLTGEVRGRVAAVSSFGSESAVLLDLVAAVDKDVPVIFINTQKIFGETLAYRDMLAEQLGLTDLRVFRPDPRRLAAKDATSLRWSYDPDGCCDLRKVEPLRRALARLGQDRVRHPRTGFLNCPATPPASGGDHCRSGDTGSADRSPPRGPRRRQGLPG